MLENLVNLHSDCELNFARLSKLMPNMDAQDRVRFLAGNYDESYLDIEVTGIDRYTRFLQLSGRMNDTPWAGEQRMAVRLYLDARMAEVISCGAERVRLLRYPYPNDHMYGPDEKNQINSFLGKWLEHFLKFGRPVDIDRIERERQEREITNNTELGRKKQESELKINQSGPNKKGATVIRGTA